MTFTEPVLCHRGRVLGEEVGWRPPPGQNVTAINTPSTIMYNIIRRNKRCKDVKGHVQRRKKAAPAQRRCYQSETINSPGQWRWPYCNFVRQSTVEKFH